MSLIKIENGTIIDPANHAQPFEGDLWIENDQLVAAPMDSRATTIINARAMVVMPGGVDIHSHFAGPKVNAARKILARTEFIRDEFAETIGSRGYVPDIISTGLRYSGLGYTTAFDAAIPPRYAISAREQIGEMPNVDAGFFALVGNHQFMLKAVADGDQDRIDQFLVWALKTTGAYAPKLVNPGLVEQWKRQPIAIDRTMNLDERLQDFSATPRQIIRALTLAGNRIGLPHPIHIHCNGLGLPGNWQTTLETMKTLGDQRGHFAHVQFHSYLGADDEVSFASAVGPLVEYVNSHKNISVDVGQVLFGSTMSMTADSPLGYYLQRLTGSPWICHDTELECGCGISPIKYKRKNRIHALQWAIGLEWMLLANDPWQVALSTDHPNGASFLAYPQIIALLMDQQLRRQQIAAVHGDVLNRSVLNEIDREYSLYEIAIITRAAPARMLGLRNKGHLGIGADADIVIYSERDDRRKMFEFPRYVIKAGQRVVDNSEPGKTIRGAFLQTANDFQSTINTDEMISTANDRYS